MDPPNVNAPEQTGGGNSLVVPRDYVVEHGDEHFARNPVGFGPYTFVSFTPDQRLESERWDGYYFPNPADEGPFNYYGNWAKTVIANFYPEESARIAALEAGEIDVADRLSPDGAALFEASDDHHVITISGLRVMGIELPINQSLDPITGGPNPWRDKRVREAANYAIDREAIIANLLSGHELPAVAPFPAGYDLPLGPSGYRGYDPDRARALLEEAGQVGVEIKLFIGTGLWGDERWMPAVQQYLNDVGFVCEVEYVNLMAALQEIRQHAVPYPFLMSQNGATKARVAGGRRLRLVHHRGDRQPLLAHEPGRRLPAGVPGIPGADRRGEVDVRSAGARRPLLGRGRDLVRGGVQHPAVQPLAPARGAQGHHLRGLAALGSGPQRPLPGSEHVGGRGGPPHPNPLPRGERGSEPHPCPPLHLDDGEGERGGGRRSPLTLTLSPGRGDRSPPSPLLGNGEGVRG